MPTRISTVPFYYVRHGETDWNLHGRMQGQTDIPLNETGREQARMAARLLANIPISSLCVSPLDRTLETATTIQDTLGVTMDIIPELQEVACGQKEGEKKGQWYTDWLDGRATPKGGETPTDFLERILCGVAMALDRPGPVLIVSHGQVFHTLTGAIGARLEHPPPNGVPIYLEPLDGGRGGWSLELIGT